MKIVDDSMSFSRQLSRLLRVWIGVRIFTDYRLLLESIGSSSQIEEKALRQSIALLKEQLEDMEVEQYSWIYGAEIVADVFTKTGSKVDGLKEIV